MWCLNWFNWEYRKKSANSGILVDRKGHSSFHKKYLKYFLLNLYMFLKKKKHFRYSKQCARFTIKVNEAKSQIFYLSFLSNFVNHIYCLSNVLFDLSCCCFFGNLDHTHTMLFLRFCCFGNARFWVNKNAAFFWRQSPFCALLLFQGLTTQNM